MAGTRAAHVAIDRPLARKIAKTAVRQRTSCDRVSTVPCATSVPNRFDAAETRGVASRRHEHTPRHHHRRRPRGGRLAVDGVRRLQRQDRRLGRAPGSGCSTPRRALGYTGPDPRAASLRRGRSGIVGVVFEEHLGAAFLDPVKTLMMDGLDRRRRLRSAPGSCSCAITLRSAPSPTLTDRSARRRGADRLQRDAARIARGRHGPRHPGRRDRGRCRRGRSADRPRQPRGAAAGGEPPAGPRPRRGRDRHPARPRGMGARLDRRRTSRSRSTSRASGSRARARCSRMPPPTPPPAASSTRDSPPAGRSSPIPTHAPDRRHRAERPARGGRHPRRGGGGTARARGRERHRLRRHRRRRARAVRAHDPRAAGGREGPRGRARRSRRCSTARPRHPSASPACSARATPPHRAPEPLAFRPADGGA